MSVLGFSEDLFMEFGPIFGNLMKLSSKQADSALNWVFLVSWE